MVARLQRKRKEVKKGGEVTQPQRGKPSLSNLTTLKPPNDEDETEPEVSNSLMLGFSKRPDAI